MNQTRETIHTAMFIKNIFSNAPMQLDMCNVGLLHPYISGHHGNIYVMSLKTKI